MPMDSTGAAIGVGDKVRWRGTVFTIRSFRPGEGRLGTSAIDFEEPLHLDEIPDEIGVDRIEEL